MHRLLRAALALAGICLSAAAYAGSLWFAQETSVVRLDTDDNEIVQRVALREAKAMARDLRGGTIWLIAEHQLLKLDENGLVLGTFPLRQFGIGESKLLAIDPYDGSVWLADGNRLAHVTDGGIPIATYGVPGGIQALALGLDQSLWVSAEHRLWHYGRDGKVLAEYSLKGLLDDDPKQLAYDSLRRTAWIAGEHQLILFDPAGGQRKLGLTFPGDIEAAAFDPYTGNLWVAHGTQLAAVQQDGRVIATMDLATLGVREAEILGFDPTTRQLWAGARNVLLRLDASGSLLATITVSGEVEALGLPAFSVDPALSLIRPPQNALTNQPAPQFTLQYGANCVGAPCILDTDYYQALALTATLNGQAVTGFQFDPVTLQANYTPTNRLPEGSNTFTAAVLDSFGHRSETVTNTFTIDTIPPAFTRLSPADGASVTTSSLTIQGSVDDPTASVVLENLADWNGQGANPAIQNFSYAVTLKPGLNTFTLAAVDRAGNTTTQQLNVTYVAAAVSLAISTPSDGAAVAGNQVLVSGTYQGPLNTGITVNGVIAAADGTRFYASVPLRTGVNVLTAQGKTPDGAVATRSVTVTSGGPGVIGVSADPDTGIAPATVVFSVFDNSSVGIQQIKVDFDGDGAIDVTTNEIGSPLRYTYTNPGIYEAKFIVTDGQGIAHAATQTVVLENGVSVDANIRGVFRTLLDRLSANDVDGALHQVAPVSQAKFYDVFTALTPDLPQVVPTLGALQPGWFTRQIAEYPVYRQTPNGTAVFLIYFVRGADGVWRIEDM